MMTFAENQQNWLLACVLAIVANLQHLRKVVGARLHMRRWVEVPLADVEASLLSAPAFGQQVA